MTTYKGDTTKYVSLTDRVNQAIGHKLAIIVAHLTKSPIGVYKSQMTVEIERAKVVYEIAESGYAKDVSLGVYKLLINKYEHNFGEKFESVFHKKIQQEIRDVETMTKYRNGQSNEI